MTQEKQSVLASIGGTIGGPRFVEQDEVCSAFPVAVSSVQVPAQFGPNSPFSVVY
jgi:hypothetical protein